MQEKIVLLDGFLTFTNSELKIKKKKGLKKSLFRNTAWLTVIAISLLFGLIRSNKSLSSLNTVRENILHGSGYIGLIILFFVILYLVFRKNWSNTININEIKKIKFDNSDAFETEVIIITHNKRERDLVFRKLENQFELFINHIQKRNSRVIIEETK